MAMIHLLHGSTLPVLILSFVAWKGVATYLQYRKLQHIKGPFIASISPLWLFYQTVCGRVNIACEQVLMKYGSPVRIGPNIIVTDDPVIVRHMGAPRSPFVRGHWFKGVKFDPRIDNVLSMTDEKRHAELRAKLMPGYTGKEVKNLESDIDDRVIELISLIRKYADSGKTFDFTKFAGYFTLDSLTQIAFGRALGFLRKDEDLYSYIKSSTDYFPILELGCNHPTIHNILNSRFMRAAAAPKPTDKLGLGRIISFAHKAVASRFGPDAKQVDDMLGSFVRHGLTQEECESESLLQIIAGSDSTATSLRTTFLYILTNPHVYVKLLAEMREATESGNVSFPVIKNLEAARLPYLQSCIKEGIRIYQPLVGLAGRVSPPEGATVNNVRIPAGVEVGIANYAMTRRADIFGVDADAFRPERWLENDTETVQKFERVWELSFGYGRSSCLGKGIAMMELGKVLFELFRNYEFAILNPFNAMFTKANAVCTQRNLILRAYSKPK